MMCLNKIGENSPFLPSFCSNFLNTHNNYSKTKERFQIIIKLSSTTHLRRSSHKKSQTSSSKSLWIMTLFSELFQAEETYKHLSALFLNRNKKINSNKTFQLWKLIKLILGKRIYINFEKHRNITYSFHTDNKHKSLNYHYLFQQNLRFCRSSQSLNEA